MRKGDIITRHTGEIAMVEEVSESGAWCKLMLVWLGNMLLSSEVYNVELLRLVGWRKGVEMVGNGGAVPALSGVLEHTGRKYIVWCQSCFDKSDHSGEEDRCCGDRAYEDSCAAACGLNY